MENIAAALVAALSDLTIVEKGRTAKISTKDGKSYSYDYADIGDVVKMTRPVLAQHGLVALTPIHDHGNGLACTVTVLHTSGERLDFGPFPFEGSRDAQATGSAVTYFRRYALVAALGMAAGDDDDGASAKAAQAPQHRREPVPQSISAGNAKTSLLDRLGDMQGARDIAARIWSEHIGDSRAITSAEWDALCEAADAAVEHYRNEPLREAEMLEAGDR